MNVIIGQEVAVYRDGLYDIGFKVVKITKTGQITAQKGNLSAVRFDKSGREIGGGEFYCKRLTTDVSRAKIEYQKQMARAMVRTLGWSVSQQATMEGLEQMIVEFEEQIRRAKVEITKAKTLENNNAPDAS